MVIDFVVGWFVLLVKEEIVVLMIFVFVLVIFK